MGIVLTGIETESPISWLISTEALHDQFPDLISDSLGAKEQYMFTIMKSI